jgi:hypothetical protein
MQLDNPVTINPGDYPEEYAELVEIMGGSINDFMRQVVDLSRSNIDFDNLTSEVLTFEVTVDETGKPTKGAAIKLNKAVTPKGFNVISARCGTAGLYPTSQPFISYTAKGNYNVSIDNISGIQANQKYQITVIAY